MSRVEICTDSSSLLSAEAVERLGVEVVPIAVSLNGDPFDEREDSLDDFYDGLRAGAAATTSLPSPADFTAAYERAAARGADAVVSIHLDGRTSGTVGAAELGARSAPIPVTIVDTRTASFGVGACVRAAVEVTRAGGSADDAAGAARSFGAALENVFVARLAPAGRVPLTETWTLLSFRDGASVPVAESASVAEAVEAMAAYPTDGGSAAVGHAARELKSSADELARAVEERGRTVERYRVGAAVGAHTGPDSFGLLWWPAPTPP